MLRTMIALGLAALLAGCSTGGLDPSPRNLDPLRDDVASALIAFDLPRGLGPAKGSLFTFDIANGGPAEHLRLQLAAADTDAIPGTLPPPGVGRAYYLFALSEPDRAAIRAAQAAANARGVASSNVVIGVVPHLCTSGGIDPQLVTVSIVAALPGRSGLLPFLSNEPLAQLLQQPGSTQMPPCA